MRRVERNLGFGSYTSIVNGKENFQPNGIMTEDARYDSESSCQQIEKPRVPVVKKTYWQFRVYISLQFDDNVHYCKCVLALGNV